MVIQFELQSTFETAQLKIHSIQVNREEQQKKL